MSSAAVKDWDVRCITARRRCSSSSSPFVIWRSCLAPTSWRSPCGLGPWERHLAKTERVVTEPMRIQRALARAGVASRRHAELLVAEGRVSVNGVAAQIGQIVDAGRDEIL